MSSCFRVFVLIALMLLSACATCAILFPIYRDKTSTPPKTTYYWYEQDTEPVVSTVQYTKTYTIHRSYTRNVACATARIYFIVSSALAVGGAGLGGLACMFVACWVMAGHRAALGIVSILITFFAFACCAVVVGLTAYLYVTPECNGTADAVGNYKAAGYQLAEGFILMAVATGGFLVMTVVQMIGMCCCFCGTNRDDAEAEYSRHDSKGSDASGSSYSRSNSRRESRSASRHSSYRN